ncbi:hypothetical protein B484DRAFT_248264 [Ochromonadaceae sp. CCMP2298]|nr:hypothetical protein B484DRAFT_248264 [Ochromonadaceae sp. CCMP2298]
MEQAKLFETFKVRNHNACVLEESLPNINPFSKDEPIVQNAAEDSDADVEEEEKSDQIESLKLIDALHRSSSVLRMVTMMLYDPENGEEKARARKVYAVRWLGQMKQSQVKQRRLDSLMNAFIKWNLEFPLAQKCDELAKQLRERNNALENVRSSYLRDVLSVKLHLDRLLDLAAKTEGQFSQLIADTLYDLHAVPSLDLRGLVKEAQGAPGQSSAQLRDNFVDLGILDPATLRTLNPWDQSHGYKRIQRLEKGHAYKMPAAEGESFQLAAPIAKRLYVRYCRECIGMTALIKDWNNEVEESLKFKADFSNVDKIIQEFRGLVIRLNGTIAHQERQIVDLTDRNHNLERANMWFEKWSGTEVVDSDELVEQRLMYKRIAEMTRVDMESLAMRTAQRFVERQNEWRAEGQLLRHKLNTAGEQKDVNYKQRVKLLDDLKKSQGALAQRALEAAHLEETCRRTLELQAAEKAKADKHVVVLDFNINELNNIVEAQEERHVTLKREMGDKVEQLTFKLQQAESELVISEDTIDQIHDELREAKVCFLSMCSLRHMLTPLFTDTLQQFRKGDRSPQDPMRIAGGAVTASEATVHLPGCVYGSALLRALRAGPAVRPSGGPGQAWVREAAQAGAQACKAGGQTAERRTGGDIRARGEQRPARSRPRIVPVHAARCTRKFTRRARGGGHCAPGGEARAYADGGTSSGAGQAACLQEEYGGVAGRINPHQGGRSDRETARGVPWAGEDARAGAAQLGSAPGPLPVQHAHALGHSADGREHQGPGEALRKDHSA